VDHARTGLDRPRRSRGAGNRGQVRRRDDSLTTPPRRRAASPHHGMPTSRPADTSSVTRDSEAGSVAGQGADERRGPPHRYQRREAAGTIEARGLIHRWPVAGQPSSGRGVYRNLVHGQATGRPRAWRQVARHAVDAAGRLFGRLRDHPTMLGGTNSELSANSSRKPWAESSGTTGGFRRNHGSHFSSFATDGRARLSDILDIAARRVSTAATASTA